MEIRPPDAALFCGTVANNIDAHTKHYTTHATALTRFMFVCNGLEEAHLFIGHLYGSLLTRECVARGQLKRTSSLGAAALLEDLFERERTSGQPRDFAHRCGNFIELFDLYKAEHNAAADWINSGAENRLTYALQLVRNLRDHAADRYLPSWAHSG